MCNHVLYGLYNILKILECIANIFKCLYDLPCSSAIRTCQPGLTSLLLDPSCSLLPNYSGQSQNQKLREYRKLEEISVAMSSKLSPTNKSSFPFLSQILCQAPLNYLQTRLPCWHIPTSSLCMALPSAWNALPQDYSLVSFTDIFVEMPHSQ